MPHDPLFAHVVLQVGNDKRLTFVDQSLRGRPLTPQSGGLLPYRDEAVSAPTPRLVPMVFPGSGWVRAAATGTDFQFAWGEFCIEACFYINTVSQMLILTEGGAFRLDCVNNLVEARASITGATWDFYNIFAPVPLSTWNYVAFYRNGYNFYGAISTLTGDQPAMATPTLLWNSAVALNNTPFDVLIGGYPTLTLFSGYLACVRITKGFGRYTGAPFLPPRVPFHMEETTIDAVTPTDRARMRGRTVMPELQTRFRYRELI